MDKNMLAALEGLPEEDKARMSAMIDHLQLRDRLGTIDGYAIVVFTDSSALLTRRWMDIFYTIEEIETRPGLRMYNSLVERCFTDCIDNFTRKTLQKQEETCVTRCAEKFLKHSMRVGMRFAELNSQAATQD
ncbi:hypothetical protein Gorai_003773 [Gossypium raimondii]|uniref:Mitochondrial import inner membrane translocase subunit n=2 Tax=Gossypium TaxID=3633 RepID=A0A7J8QQ47_GOSRA|nr:hypothetical protein [Gossypium raimondii]